MVDVNPRGRCYPILRYAYILLNAGRKKLRVKYRSSPVQNNLVTSPPCKFEPVGSKVCEEGWGGGVEEGLTARKRPGRKET